MTVSYFVTTTSTSDIVISSAETIRRLLPGLSYKPGWTFRLQGDALGSCSLAIEFRSLESRTLTEQLFTHRFPIPPDAYSWTSQQAEDWIFARIVDVERHEAGEFFETNGERPFFPPHGYPSDPYDVRRRAS